MDQPPNLSAGTAQHVVAYGVLLLMLVAVVSVSASAAAESAL
jgi:hypothetical protein